MNRFYRGGDSIGPASTAGPERSHRCIPTQQELSALRRFRGGSIPIKALSAIYRHSRVRQPALLESVICRTEFLSVSQSREACLVRPLCTDRRDSGRVFEDMVDASYRHFGRLGEGLGCWSESPHPRRLLDQRHIQIDKLLRVYDISNRLIRISMIMLISSARSLKIVACH
jgi:hypothetical protein